MAISESYQDDALFAIPTTISDTAISSPNPNDRDDTVLTEQLIKWPEGKSGFSLGDCITPYLQQATEITISDPNIGLIHQQDNLLELLTTIANAKPPSQQSNVQLITSTPKWRDWQIRHFVNLFQHAC